MSIRMTRRTLNALVAASMVALVAPLPALAQSAAEKGFQIAAQADRSDRGFTDSRVELQMILKNASGKTSTRTLEISTLEIPSEDAGDKSMILFTAPGDIDGTAR